MKPSLIVFLILFWGGAIAGAATITATETASQTGVDDTSATAQSLGVLAQGAEFVIDGAISDNNFNDVDFYSFTLNAGASLFFDIDLADDIGASADDDTGVDTTLAVFDSSNNIVAWNDDSDAFDTLPDPGSTPFGERDALIGPLALAEGTYYVAVAVFGNYPNAIAITNIRQPLDVSGFRVVGNAPPGSTYELDRNAQTNGPYQLRISGVFDGQPVPEPGTLSLLGLGLLGLAGLGRRPGGA